MANNRTRASLLKNLDAELATLIAERTGCTPLDGLRIFLASETHAMLEDDDLKLWHFSPLALFDMWIAETATGNPRNSAYLGGDGIE